MTAKHTPGPWTIDDDLWIVSGSAQIVRVGATRLPDAVLIAAAPALADELERLLKHLHQYGSEHLPEYEPAHVVLRAAGLELERDSVIAECKHTQKDLDAQSNVADALADAGAELLALLDSGAVRIEAEEGRTTDMLWHWLGSLRAALRAAGRLP